MNTRTYLGHLGQSMAGKLQEVDGRNCDILRQRSHVHASPRQDVTLPDL
jgi:hypothetical protein